MFEYDPKTGNVSMHVGDTGAYKVRAARKSGEPFTEYDRMIFTVLSGSGEIVLQRYYRLDTDLGDGVAEIQFHNADTDRLSAGMYSTERRYVLNAYWSGTGDIPDGDVVNALESARKIVDGDIVRVPKGDGEHPGGQATMTLSTIYGEV